MQWGPYQEKNALSDALPRGYAPIKPSEPLIQRMQWKSVKETDGAI
jgi:hypothetical protein